MKQQLKVAHVAQALVLSAALFSIASAQASTSNLGLLADGDTFSGGPTSPTASFIDIYTFTLPTFVDLSSGASATPVYKAGTSIYSKDIPSGDVSIYSGVFAGVNSLLGTYSFGRLSGSTGQLEFGVLSGGPGNQYYYQITGLADGIKGGIYTVTTSLTPVPEPETYGMLIAGLGLMGFIARRRTKKV